MAESLGSQPGDELEIATDAGLRVCRIDSVQRHSAFTVEMTIGMGVPKFMPHTLKLTAGAEIVGVEVSTGNPHFVILADNPDFAVAGKPWQTIGAEICMHRDFPQQTNVEFVRIVSEREIEIRIFERGVGPTTSSGTGSFGLRHCGAGVAPLRFAAQRRRSRRRANRCMERAGNGTAANRTGHTHCARRGMVRWRA